MDAQRTELRLTPALKAGLIDLLYRLGDDALIIGHRNSEWTGIGPILEEDIAFSSMAQDKLGHALAYYALLHELGEPDPDHLAFRRVPADFRCCSLLYLESLHESGEADSEPGLCNNPDRDLLVRHGDWAIALVRQFLFSPSLPASSAAS
jgi:phenylacetate-CoA oxygenase PaaI subunit